MNDADEFRAGIFQQVDFYQILWGAISTRGPSTFLEIISKQALHLTFFFSFNIYLEVLYFLLNYPNIFSVIFVYMQSSRSVNYQIMLCFCMKQFWVCHIKRPGKYWFLIKFVPGLQFEKDCLYLNKLFKRHFFPGVELIFKHCIAVLMPTHDGRP